MASRLLSRLMVVVLVILFVIVGPKFIYGQTHMDSGAADSQDQWKDFWLFRLLLNFLGYATIFVPGYLIIRYIKDSGYLERAGHGCLPKIIRMCVQGGEQEKVSLEEAGQKTEEIKAERSLCQQALLLCWCAGGLLGSYLIWGLLQERIMAFRYGAEEGNPDSGENFKNSQFLVFMNRILALCVAVLVLTLRQQPKHSAPLYKYSYSSFSNIMSSWCQYEALKFVSFPVQVLAKASKVIPVMLMGKIVSKRTYEYYEYVTAVMISLGIALFLLSSKDWVRGNGTVTTFSGFIILIGYLLFDAFTANWQGELFKVHKMSSIQMMAGVNLFSVIFTSVSLIEQGGFIESLAFMGKYPVFVTHIVLLSICSATGQLFIFYTIAQYGAVTFTIIMTIRQGVAILLSCVIYHHPVSVLGVFGILIVFGAVFLKIYCNRRNKSKKKPKPSIPQPGNDPIIVVTDGMNKS